MLKKLNFSSSMMNELENIDGMEIVVKIYIQIAPHVRLNQSEFHSWSRSILNSHMKTYSSSSLSSVSPSLSLHIKSTISVDAGAY